MFISATLVSLIDKFIGGNTGIIKINGQLWSAKSIDGTVYAVNEKVIVDKLVGNTIYVKKGDI